MKTLFRLLLCGLILMIVLGLGLAPVRPASAAAWEKLKDPMVSGGVINFLVKALSDPNVVYAVMPTSPWGDQMLYKSLDGGQAWQSVSTAAINISSLAVDPENSQILFATFLPNRVNPGLYRSTNSGADWQSVKPVGYLVSMPAPGRIYLVDIATSADCAYALLDNFWRSLDGGLTWQHSQIGCAEDPPGSIFVNPANPDQIYLSHSGKQNFTWMSADGGLTWQRARFNNLDAAVLDLAFDPAQPGRIFMASAGGVLHTENGGQSWDSCAGIPDGQPYRLLYAQGILHMISSGSMGSMYGHIPVYMSQDLCQTWWKSVQDLPGPVQQFLATPGSPLDLIAGTWGYGIFRSSSGGAAWQESNTGLSSAAQVNMLALAPSDPNVILAHGWWPRKTLLRSEDGGATWAAQNREDDVYALLIHPADPKKAWMVTTQGIYQTGDGSHWVQSYYGGGIYQIDVSAAAPDRPCAAASGGGIQGSFIVCQEKLFDNEFTWKRYPIPGTYGVDSIAINPQDALDILAVASVPPPTVMPTIFRSLDGGLTWHAVGNFYPYGKANDLIIDPQNPSVRYVLLSYMRIFRSTDSGETWSDWSGQQGSLFKSGPYALSIDRFGGVYAFTYAGDYHRAPHDPDWTLIEPVKGLRVSAYWRGDSPYLLQARSDGLWRFSFPPVQRLWFPIAQR